MRIQPAHPSEDGRAHLRTSGKCRGIASRCRARPKSILVAGLKLQPRQKRSIAAHPASISRLTPGPTRMRKPPVSRRPRNGRWLSLGRGYPSPRINFKRKRPLLAGGVLLSHGLHRSTIGARGLNFRVRDGTGCASPAMAAGQQGAFCLRSAPPPCPQGRTALESVLLQRTRPRACPPRAGEGGTSKSSDD